ncbi:MAG: peptidase protein [Parcubacteria group bacterium]|nr:peptidase protein [Parcubacteria group bacterium]
MRVMVVPLKDTNTATVLALVEAGSKYETKDKNGISHFLEHMCFKGTTKRPTSLLINAELDGLGAQHNAFTSEEFTGYYAKAEASKLSQIVDVISDMYLDPIFPEADMQKEKGVIIQEISMKEDNPQRLIHSVFKNLVYGDQPAGWTILGPKKNIQKMKREDFVEYRKKHYVAKATTVVVAGKVEASKAFNMIEKAFKNISTDKKHQKLKARDEQKTPRILIKKKDTDQTHLILGFRTFDTYDKRNETLSVMNGVLSGGMSSRLFHKLRDEMGACYYVYSYVDDQTDHGHLAIGTGIEDKRLIEVVGVLLSQCKKLAEELVSPEELRKVKDHMIGGLYLGLETSDALAEFYGFQEVIKRKLKTPEEMKADIEKVKAEDIRKLAREIFKDAGLNLALIGRAKEAQKLKKILTLSSVKN